jgi:hypothetical protein
MVAVIAPVGNCECDWPNCGHKGRTVPTADHGDNIRTSPELCTACLFVCEGEREDEMDDL